MRLTFLGTGTSMGVPVIGCRCVVCRSPDPRNHRLRTSALLEIHGHTLLIDAGPDLRQQALRADIRRLDGVLFTHAHADHILGVDDLRPLNYIQQRAIPLYGSEETLTFIRTRFSYAFEDASAGSSRPALDPKLITDQPFEAAGAIVTPLPVQHGTWPILGYRIGGLGYITDASAIPETTRELLRGVDVLVLNALRYRPHPTHLTVPQALEIVADLQPQRAFFVHMNHELDHERTNATFPSHVQLAYDGLVIEVADLAT